MNLRSIANSLTQSINPNKQVIARRYAGMTVGPGRVPIPSYSADESVTVQLQPLSSGDLKHIDGLNIQGVVKSLYVNGDFYSNDRKLNKGGDIFIIDGQTWLVIDMVEQWNQSGWTRVIINLQVDANV